MQCVTDILVHYLRFCRSAFPRDYAESVYIPEFKSHKICEDFSPKNKDDYFQCV